MILIIKPNDASVVRIQEVTDKQIESLKRLLTFRDRAAEWAYKKFRHAHWYLNQHGEAAWKAELENKKNQIEVSLLQQDDEGYCCYTGLIPRIIQQFPDAKVQDLILKPEAKSIPWAQKPLEMRPYQVLATEQLLDIRHGAVEIATGLGKSRIIFELVRKLGLKTTIMAPLGSIADQLYRDLTKLLGPKYVGMFGGGKKISKKLITVGIHASLTKVEPGSDHWDNLSGSQVFIVDESHMTPASSLEKVCMGLCRKAPYRFFFSATQMRGDGAELVLQGITGPIVSSMTFQEGVDQKFLAKPHFKMVKVPSNVSFQSKDANEMTRAHLYYNPDVYRKAGQIINAAITQKDHRVLVLVKEVEQFSYLLPYLRHEVHFAHGGLTKENKGKVPEAFHDSDPLDLVDRFNAGAFPILVGTSCISTGTDLRIPQTILYMMGQASEIQVKQAVGRGTRMPAGKEEFFYFDFMPCLPQDQEEPRYWSIPHRHAHERLAYYRDLYPDVSLI
jgi:superfamily II DNA or RNA helicase